MSYNYFLDKDMHINWKERLFIVHSIDKEVAVLDADGEKSLFNTLTLLQDYSEGLLTVVQKNAPIVYQSLSQKEDIQRVELMNSYLLELDKELTPGSRNTIKQVIDDVVERYSYTYTQIVSVSTLYRWYQKWVDCNRNTAALVSKPKQKRRSQIEPCVFDLADDVIFDEYLQLNGAKRSQVYLVYLELHKKRFPDLRPIGKSRFYELFEELDPVEVTLAREGRDAARRFKRTNLSVFVSNYLGERVEIDAVHFKVGLLDDEGNYLGCPILYIAIDVHTRYVVGYHIGIEPIDSGKTASENSADVIECIKHIVQPKPRRDYLKNAWHFTGVPRSIVCDAGTAFRSKSVISLLAHLKTEHHTTETASPWKKPFIERFNRTLRDHFAHTIPGYVGRRVHGKQFDRSVEEMATFTLDKFREKLEIFFVDIYNQNPHKGLGKMSPAQALEYELERRAPPVLPDMNNLHIWARQELTGTLQPHDGIQKNCLKYNSDELRALFNELSSYEAKGNPKVNYLYDLNDIKTIYVIHPKTMTLVEARCTRPDVEKGMSLARFNARKDKCPISDSRAPERSAMKPANASKANKANVISTTQSVNEPITREKVESLLDSSAGLIAKNHSDKQLAIKPSKNKPSQSVKDKTISRKPSQIKEGK